MYGSCHGKCLSNKHVSILTAKKRSMPSNAKNSGCSGEDIFVPASECLVSFHLSRMNSESKSDLNIKQRHGIFIVCHHICDMTVQKQCEGNRKAHYFFGRATAVIPRRLRISLANLSARPARKLSVITSFGSDRLTYSTKPSKSE